MNRHAMIAKMGKRYWLLPSLLFALGGALVGCHAQESTTPVAPQASPIHTPAEAQNNNAPLVTGLPDFTKLADYVSPAVVNIRVSEKVATQQGMDLRGHPICQIWPDIPGCNARSAPQSGGGATEREAGQGSGFITSQDGYILTNHHVVNGASTITVVLPDKREFKAQVIGSDARTDVALIKIDATGLPFLRMADSNKLKVGEWVMAAGSPFGLKNTITAGVVSAINRDTGDYLSFIQTDAAINPGNSGGPLVNYYGQVVGITTSKIVSETYEGMGFAIPSQTVKSIVDTLVKNGYVEGRVKIGISGIAVTSDQASNYNIPQGIYVQSIVSGGPCDGTSLEEGDIITEVDGETITSFADVYAILETHKPGDKIKVKYYSSSSGDGEVEITLQEDK